jgi:regulator of protease activity HflC (stomatin/prohibitin superfamily)
MNISVLGTQDSTHFFIDIPLNLTLEGILAHILVRILDTIKGILTDENNETITDDNNNPVTFDNSAFYASMPLSLWRVRINGSWYEYQLVFKLREIYAD